MLCVASELCRSNERFTFSVRLFVGGALFICADTIENVWEVPMSGSSSNKPKGNMNKIVSGVTAVTSLITLAKPVADTIQESSYQAQPFVFPLALYLLPVMRNISDI